MKNNILILLILNIIVLSVNLFFNLPINMFLFGLGVLLLIYASTFFKSKPIILITVSVPAVYFIVSTLLEHINIPYIIFVLCFILYYVFSFKYVFNLINNNMNIQFTNIKIPDNKEYLVIKYISGPISGSNFNSIIIKEKDYFELLVENKENIVNKIDILFNDIEEIKVDEKPYMKSTKSLSNYETDYMKSYSIGRYTGDFERVKDFKMIPSYEINILLKNNISIKILSFNRPNIFEN